MNMLWVNTIGGKLKMDYRYTNLCYNTFPFPSISDTKKSEIEEAATEVLLARENYPDKTLADLYDPDKMPVDLRMKTSIASWRAVTLAHHLLMMRLVWNASSSFMRK